MQECPFCREKIKEGAKKCRYCNEYLPEGWDKRKKKSHTKFKLLAMVPLFLILLSIGVFFVVYNSLYGSPERASTNEDTYIKPIESYSRLNNGQVIDQVGSFFNGEGELSISNGASDDAIVKLAIESSKSTAMEVYVQAGSSYTIKNIKDSTYVVLINSGRDYNASNRGFNLSNYYFKFEENFKFETTDSQYTTFSITLNEVAGGNARTSDISASEFNNY